MKRILSICASSLVLSLVCIFTMSSCSNDNNGVNMICDTYDKMANEISKCKSLSEFQNLDLSKVLNSNEEEINKQYADYELTQSDKQRIIESFNKVITTTCDKTAEISGGMVTKETMEQNMQPIIELHTKATESAKTIGEYLKLSEKMSM